MARDYYATDKQKNYVRRMRLALGMEPLPESEFEYMTGSRVGTMIDYLKPRYMAMIDSQEYRPGSMRAIIAESLKGNGLNVDSTYREYAPLIGTGEFTFTRAPKPGETPNFDGNRMLVTGDQARGRLMSAIKSVEAKLREKGYRPGSPTPAPPTPDYTPDPYPYTPTPDSYPYTPTPTPTPTPQPYMDDEDEDEDDSPPPEAPAPWEPPAPRMMTAREYLEKIRELRAFCVEREANSSPITDVGLRPLKSGRAMFDQGIPYEAALHSFTMEWPNDIRERFGIKEIDLSTLKIGEPLPKREHVPAPQNHTRMPYTKALAAARVPIQLIGPAGTGKTTLAAMLAQELGLPFGLIPMTQGATPSWLTGAYTLDGFKTRPFLEIYREGGVFLFDEMDAAEPNLLLLVNSAIDGADGFFNPSSAEFIPRHADFIPVSAMNTMGNGSDTSYTGRNSLDLATLDRWKLGRIMIQIDPKIEEWIMFSGTPEWKVS